MFVCLWFFVPLENFSLIWRRHHCRWRAAIFYLYSALVAIEQRGFFSVPHPLWHGASVYNGHLRGPEDPWHSHLLRAFSSGAVTTYFYDLGLSRLGFQHTTFRLVVLLWLYKGNVIERVLNKMLWYSLVECENKPQYLI